MKPCPFCGGKYSVYIGKHQSGGEWWYVPWCKQCMMFGPPGKTVQDAANAWNKRADRVMPMSVIQALQGIAKEIHAQIDLDECFVQGRCGMRCSEAKDHQCENAIAVMLARAAGWEV